MTQVCLPPGWVSENGGICAVGNILDVNGFAVGCPDPPYQPPIPIGCMIYSLYDVHQGPPAYGGAQMIPFLPPLVPPFLWPVEFTDVQYNLGGLYDPLTPNHIIIPVSGIWLITYSIKMAAPQEYLWSITTALFGIPNTGFFNETSQHPAFPPLELHGLSSQGSSTIHIDAGADLWIGVYQESVGQGDPDLPIESCYFSAWLLNRD